jgi:hypothetical protein
MSAAATVTSAVSPAPVSAAAVAGLLSHRRVMTLHDRLAVSASVLSVGGEHRLRPSDDEDSRAERDEQPEDDAERERWTPDFQYVRLRHALRTS